MQLFSPIDREKVYDLIDNYIFRPVIWAFNWKPGANYPVHYYWQDDEDE
jgi:hypothetical protein